MSAGLKANADGSAAIQVGGSDAITITSGLAVAIPQTLAVTGAGSVAGNLSFNSGYGSSAVAYGCRAWVNFNGTGTVAIRASGNVTSITDNGTGDYTVNFTTAMVDANYAAVSTAGDASTDARIAITTTLATGSYKITTRTVGNALFDTLTVQSAVFR
jgi:hypothetical protein